MENANNKFTFTQEEVETACKEVETACKEVETACKEVYGRGVDHGIIASGISLIAAVGLCKVINVLKQKRKK